MVKIGDFEVFPLGMGGIPIQRLNRSEAEYLLQFAVDQGINFFDTARAYGCSESYFSVLNRWRQRVFVGTKSLARTLDSLKKDFEESRRNLKMDYLDLFQLHNVAGLNDWEKIKNEGIIDFLQEQKAAGKISLIGISGHKPPVLLKILRQFSFLIVQFPFNYLECEAQKELLPFLKVKNMISVAMKPIGGGNFCEVRANLKFIRHSGVDIVIPGFDSPRQIVEVKDIFQNEIELNADEFAKLEGEKERLGSEFCRRCEYCQPCPQGLPIAFLHVLRQYYYSYGLKDWALSRMRALEHNYLDCIDCKQCLQRCPYEIDSGKIFQCVAQELKNLLTDSKS